LALVAAGLPAGSASAAGAACADTMVFEVGGTTDPTAAGYNHVNETLPQGFAATPIHYPAQLRPLPEAGTTHEAEYTLDESAAIGEANLRAAVHEFHAACPGSHLLLTGISQGALVAGNVLGELAHQDEIPHDKIDGVLYADPRRKPANGFAGGLMTNLPTFLDGLTMQGPRGFGDLAVHQICYQNDGVCKSDNPITNLPAFANGIVGWIEGAHGMYVLDPVHDRGSGDTVIAQAPAVPYGPSLPIPAPTLYTLLNGKLPTAAISKVVQGFASLVYALLNAGQRAEFRTFVDGTGLSIQPATDQNIAHDKKWAPRVKTLVHNAEVTVRQARTGR
jgi:hypothetical protein